MEDKNANPSSDKKTMVVSLPQDVILFQILTRVPAKSIIRFKCVSKQWNSFLMSEKFKEMHNRNLLIDPHLEDHNLFFYSRAAATFFTIDYESLPIKPPCPRPLPKFEAIPPQYMYMLSSYHGLILIAKRDCQDDYIILWNPLIAEYKRLSKPSNPDHMECYKYSESAYGLYYSSCEDDYKLLVVAESRNVYIYSLKYDSWRKLNKKAPFQVDWQWKPGFCLSKSIYFLGYKARHSIRFDTTAERFHKIETSPEFDNTHSTAITVGKGTIHLCVKYDIFGGPGLVKSTSMELWKFNADGDNWSKLVTYQLGSNHDIGYMCPLHLMRNGNWLMKNHREKGRFCQVELKKKINEDKDGHDKYKLYYSNIEGYYQEVRYTETFVSPNRYMK